MSTYIDLAEQFGSSCHVVHNTYRWYPRAFPVLPAHNSTHKTFLKTLVQNRDSCILSFDTDPLCSQISAAALIALEDRQQRPRRY